MQKVITGDGQYQKEQEIELKELNYDVGKETRWHFLSRDMSLRQKLFGVSQQHY